MSGISRTVPEIEREIQIINRRCLRFRTGFKQEKEEAILKGVQSLIILRERSIKKPADTKNSFSRRRNGHNVNEQGNACRSLN